MPDGNSSAPLPYAPGPSVEMVGDHVTIEVREVPVDHHGDTIVRGAYDGTFDHTNLVSRATTSASATARSSASS